MGCGGSKSETTNQTTRNGTQSQNKDEPEASKQEGSATQQETAQKTGIYLNIC